MRQSAGCRYNMVSNKLTNTTRHQWMPFVSYLPALPGGSSRSVNQIQIHQQDQAKYSAPGCSHPPETAYRLLYIRRLHYVARKTRRTTTFIPIIQMSLSDSDSKPVETTKQPTSKPGDVATYEKTNPLIRVLVSILTFGLNNNAISAKESEFRPQSPSPEARRTIGSKQDEDQGQVQVQDQNDLISVLERDYANEYFLTGAITDAAYEPDCLFVDPTVTIRGLSKWKQSIGNLGYFFLTEVIDARTDTEGKSQGKRKQRLVLKDIEMKDNAVYTRWVLDVLLKLPWKPRVQVFGTTIHSINARTKRIQRHEERWTTSVPAAFRQLFTPSQQGEGTKSRGISSQGREQ